MKKINIALLTICMVLSMVSCDSDRDSNPTIKSPDTFVLNTPDYASNNIDLLTSKDLELSCVQPDYGYTAAVIYSVQVSLDNTWNDETETEEATYATLETTYTTAKMKTVASELAKGVVRVAGWTQESDVPDGAITVYVRLKAHLGTGIYPVYSNSVELSVIPYYIELRDAIPATYYLLGSPIGDGSWANEVGKVGVSMIPMALVEDVDYDKVTGKGEFIYTGYFPKDAGFKIVGVVGSWDEQWGNADAPGINNLVYNDGGSKDLAVPADGWYTITLNSRENKLSIKGAAISPTAYAGMELVGTFNNWANDGVLPTKLTRIGGENSHVWYGSVTLVDGDECKFRTDNTWTNSWGGDSFPFALTNGSNIPCEAGDYAVIFNDLDKCYYFIKKETE